MSGNYTSWAPLPVRLSTGGGLAYHGFPKLFTRFGRENIVHLLRRSGAPAPEIVAWPVGCLECFGGLAIAAGYRVRPISAAVLGMIVFNVLTELRLGGLPAPAPGRPVAPQHGSSAFYAGGSLSVLLAGPGRLSVSGG